MTLKSKLTDQATHVRLEIHFPTRHFEQLTLLLWEAGTTGIEEHGDGLLSAFFLVGELPRRGEMSRIRALAASVTAHDVEIKDWIRASQRHLRAQRIGPLLVRPPWSRARPRLGEHEIVIDPGQAFGTAGHESTRLALRAMLETGVGGRRLLDIGCGSGVLAFAAVLLGASTVLAIDNDADAIAATRENSLKNRIGVVTRLAGPEGVRGRFGVVVANLTAPLLVALKEAIAARVSAGGRLILAGFLAHDVSEVTRVYESLGFSPIHSWQEREWVSLALGRPAR